MFSGRLNPFELGSLLAKFHGIEDLSPLLLPGDGEGEYNGSVFSIVALLKMRATTTVSATYSA